VPTPTNTQSLSQLMADYQLSPLDVARLLNRSYQTVLIWRSVSPQDIPDTLLELLDLKLRDIASREPARCGEAV